MTKRRLLLSLAALGLASPALAQRPEGPDACTERLARREAILERLAELERDGRPPVAERRAAWRAPERRQAAGECGSGSCGRDEAAPTRGRDVRAPQERRFRFRTATPPRGRDGIRSRVDRIERRLRFHRLRTQAAPRPRRHTVPDTRPHLDERSVPHTRRQRGA